MSSEVIIYENQDGNIKIDVRLEEETVWLTQEQIAVLFGKSRSTITEHISNVFKEGELTKDVVCRKFRLTTQHGAIAGKTQEKIVSYQYSRSKFKTNKLGDIGNLLINVGQRPMPYVKDI